MTNGNGNTVKVNRGTLAVAVVACIAMIGWGSSLYNGHEKRIRTLEVTAAIAEENTKAIMEQSDDITFELRAMRDALIAAGVKFPAKR